MRTATILLSLALAAVSVSGAPRGFGGFGGNKGSTTANKGSNNAGSGAAAATASNATAAAATASNSTAAASTASNSTAAASTAANSTAAASTGSNNAAASSGNVQAGSLSTTDITTAATADSTDAQSSLTLSSAVIATGFQNNGQDVQEAGQVASLTSNNNFINYCLTQSVPITNGQQITTGSCNPAPIGTIPSVANMPSAKFSNPANGDTIPANTAFTISMNINNIDTGNFVNAAESYFAAPQQLNAQGQIIGHTHVVIESLSDLAQTTPTNPQTFAFFKGVNTAAVNGAVTAAVASGVPAGSYRLCSINSSSNHQPVIVPIAQHGSLDDCVYFTASGSGATASNATAAAGSASNSTAAAGTAAAGTAAAGTAATGTAAAAGTGTAAASSTAASKGTTKGGNNAGAAAGKTGKGKRMMASRAIF